MTLRTCSMSLAILFPPFDLHRYRRNVAVWPTLWPPTGRVGSPKKASGFACTWFVTAMAVGAPSPAPAGAGQDPAPAVSVGLDGR